MRCDECFQDPCRCQRALAVVSRQQAAPQKYDFRECVTPGCTVMIGFLVGSMSGLTTCKWCQAGRSHAKVR